MPVENQKNDTPPENTYAVEKIFAEYGEFIYQTILYKVKKKADAGDLYNAFFISLSNNPIPLSTENIRGYLYKAILNDIADADRQERSYQNLIEKYSENFKFLINKDDSTNAFNSRKRFEEILKRNWNCMSPNETRAIILRYMESCDLNEIAAKMNVKKKTASRYISVGVKKLRHSLENEGKQNEYEY